MATRSKATDMHCSTNEIASLDALKEQNASLQSELEAERKLTKQLRREKSYEIQKTRELEQTKASIAQKDLRMKLHLERNKEQELLKESLGRKYELDLQKVMRPKDAELIKLRGDLRRCQDELGQTREQLTNQNKGGLSVLSARGAFDNERQRLLAEVQELRSVRRHLENELKTMAEAEKRREHEIQQLRCQIKVEVAKVEKEADVEVKRLLEELKSKDRLAWQKQKESATQTEDSAATKLLMETPPITPEALELTNGITEDEVQESHTESPERNTKDTRPLESRIPIKKDPGGILQLKVKEVTSRNKELEEEITSLKGDKTQLQQKIKDMEKKHRTTLEKNKRFLEKNIEVTNINRNLEEKIKKLNDDLNKLRSQSEKFKKEQNKLTEQLSSEKLDKKTSAELRCELDELREQSVQQEKTVTALKMACNEKDRRIELLVYKRRKQKNSKYQQKMVRFILPAKVHSLANGVKETYFGYDEDTMSIDSEMSSTSCLSSSRLSLDMSNEDDDVFDEVTRSDLEQSYQRLMKEHLELEKSYALLQAKAGASHIDPQRDSKDMGWLDEKETLTKTIRMLKDKIKSQEAHERRMTNRISEIQEENEELEFRILELAEINDKLKEDVNDTITMKDPPQMTDNGILQMYTEEKGLIEIKLETVKERLHDMKDGQLDKADKLVLLQARAMLGIADKKLKDLTTTQEHLKERIKKLEAEKVELLSAATGVSTDLILEYEETRKKLEDSEQKIKDLEDSMAKYKDAEAVFKYTEEQNQRVETHYKQEITTLQRQLSNSHEGREYESELWHENQEKIKNYERQIQELEAKCEPIQERVDLLEMENSHLQCGLTQLQCENSRLQCENTQLHNEKTQLFQAGQDEQRNKAKIEDYEKVISEHIEKYTSLQEELERHKESCEVAKKCEVALQETNIHLEHELKEAIERCCHLENKIESIKLALVKELKGSEIEENNDLDLPSSLQVFIEQVHILLKEKEALQKLSDELSKKNNKLLQELEEKASQLEDYDKQRGLADDEAKCKLQQDKNKLQEDNNILQNDNEKLQEDTKVLQTDKNILQEDKIKLQKVNDKLQEDKNKLQKISDQLEEYNKKLLGDKHRLQEDSIKLQEDNSKLQEEFNKLQKDSIKLQEDKNKVDEDNIILQEDKNALQEVNKRLQEERDELQQHKTRLQEELVKSKKDAENEAIQLNNQSRSLIEKVKSLEVKLKDSREEHLQLRDSIALMEEEKSRRIQQLQTQLDQSEENEAQLYQNINELKQNEQVLQQEVKSLESSLKDKMITMETVMKTDAERVKVQKKVDCLEMRQTQLLDSIQELEESNKILKECLEQVKVREAKQLRERKETVELSVNTDKNLLNIEEQMQKEVDIKKKLIKEFQKTISEYESQLETLQDDLKKANKQIETLIAEQEKKDFMIEEFLDREKENKLKVKELESSEMLLKAHLSDANKAVYEKETAEKRLLQDLEQAKTTKDELNSRVSELEKNDISLRAKLAGLESLKNDLLETIQKSAQHTSHDSQRATDNTSHQTQVQDNVISQNNNQNANDMFLSSTDIQELYRMPKDAMIARIRELEEMRVSHLKKIKELSDNLSSFRQAVEVVAITLETDSDIPEHSHHTKLRDQDLEQRIHQLCKSELILKMKNLQHEKNEAVLRIQLQEAEMMLKKQTKEYREAIQELEEELDRVRKNEARLKNKLQYGGCSADNPSLAKIQHLEELVFELEANERKLKRHLQESRDNEEEQRRRLSLLEEAQRDGVSHVVPETSRIAPRCQEYKDTAELQRHVSQLERAERHLRCKLDEFVIQEARGNFEEEQSPILPDQSEASLRQKIHELEVLQKHLKYEVESLERDRTELDEISRNDKDYIHDLNIKVMRLEQTEKNLKEQINKMETTEKNLTLKNEDLEEDVKRSLNLEKQLKAQLVKSESKEATLAMQLEHAKEDIRAAEDKYKQKVNELEKERKQLALKVDELTDELGDSHGIEMSLKQKLRNIENTEMTLKNKITELENALEIAKKRAEELETFNDTLAQKLHKIEEEKSSLRYEMSDLVVLNIKNAEELHRRLKILQEGNKQLVEAKACRNDEELAKLKKDISQLSSLSQAYEILKSNHEDSKRQLKQMEKRLAEANAQVIEKPSTKSKCIQVTLSDSYSIHDLQPVKSFCCLEHDPEFRTALKNLGAHHPQAYHEFVKALQPDVGRRCSVMKVTGQTDSPTAIPGRLPTMSSNLPHKHTAMDATQVCEDIVVAQQNVKGKRNLQGKPSVQVGRNNKQSSLCDKPDPATRKCHIGQLVDALLLADPEPKTEAPWWQIVETFDPDEEEKPYWADVEVRPVDVMTLSLDVWGLTTDESSSEASSAACHRTSMPSDVSVPPLPESVPPANHPHNMSLDSYGLPNDSGNHGDDSADEAPDIMDEDDGMTPLRDATRAKSAERDSDFSEQSFLQNRRRRRKQQHTGSMDSIPDTETGSTYHGHVIKSMKERIAELEAKLQDSKNESSALRSKDILMSDCTNLQKDNSHLKSLLEDKTNELTAQTTQIKQLTDELKCLRAELASTKQENITDKQCLKTVEGDLSKFKDIEKDYTRLQQKHSELLSEHESIKERFTYLKEAGEDVVSKTDLIKKLQTKLSNYNKITIELQSSEKKVKALEEKLKEMAHIETSITHENVKLLHHVETLQQSIDHYHALEGHNIRIRSKNDFKNKDLDIRTDFKRKPLQALSGMNSHSGLTHDQESHGKDSDARVDREVMCSKQNINKVKVQRSQSHDDMYETAPCNGKVIDNVIPPQMSLPSVTQLKSAEGYLSNSTPTTDNNTDGSRDRRQPYSTEYEVPTFIAVNNYNPEILSSSGQQQRELPLHEGDIVKVLGPENGRGYCEAEVKGRIGLVPALYLIPATPNQVTHPKPKAYQPPPDAVNTSPEQILNMYADLAQSHVPNYSVSSTPTHSRKSSVSGHASGPSSLVHPAFTKSPTVSTRTPLSPSPVVHPAFHRGNQSHDTPTTNTVLPSCPPGPPSDFHIQRTVGDNSALLSWLPPAMDEFARSNGITVKGYKIYINNKDTQFIPSAHMSKAFIENLNLHQGRTTFSIQTIGEHGQRSRQVEAICVDNLPGDHLTDADCSQDKSPQKPIKLSENNGDTKRLCFAIYDYIPSIHSKEELPLATGDVVVTYGSQRDDGFYYGKVHGKKGLVPASFIEQVPVFSYKNRRSASNNVSQASSLRSIPGSIADSNHSSLASFERSRPSSNRSNHSASSATSRTCSGRKFKAGV